MALLLPHNKFWLKIERLLKPLGVNLARWIRGSGGSGSGAEQSVVSKTVDGDRDHFSDDEVDRIRGLLRLPLASPRVCPHCGEDLLVKKVVAQAPGLWHVRCARCSRSTSISGVDI